MDQRGSQLVQMQQFALEQLGAVILGQGSEKVFQQSHIFGNIIPIGEILYLGMGCTEQLEIAAHQCYGISQFVGDLRGRDRLLQIREKGRCVSVGIIYSLCYHNPNTSFSCSLSSKYGNFKQNSIANLDKMRQNRVGG